MDKSLITADDDAEALVQRAYALSSAADSKALYRDWANTYDHSMVDDLGYLTPQLTAKLLAEHIDSRDAQVLDVGSGTGLAGVALHAAGFTQLHALDFSPEMLAVADRRGIYQTLIEADLTNTLTMLTDDQFDAMICTGTFTHSHVGAECLAELWRILVPGGILACTVHHAIWDSSGFARTIAKMESAGDLRTVYRKPGPYYASSDGDEGDYIVWKNTSKS